MTGTNNQSKEFIIKHRDILVCLFLIMATLSVYWQAYSYDFVALDDDKYYYENRYVQDGLTVENIIWSFTNNISGMWIPITWLSYMTGSNLYGTSPGWHHLTNVFLHIANVLLLCLLFRRMTGAFWPSVVVASLFALHPIHVESVAWITERKDVLSTFFFLLTIWGYHWYVDRPTTGKYILMLTFYTLGLMAKPTIVTLPFVLLLLDYWPMDRIKFQQFNARNDDRGSCGPLYLILEKIPFFALAAAASVVTFIATRKLEAIIQLPICVKIANALISYVKYIGKMIWPSKMAVFYPHPGILPWWKILGAFLVLAGISGIVIKNIVRRPYWAVGWFWYIGTLVTNIGLVQAGTQAMADRFVYIPFIGLYIIISWSFLEIALQLQLKKILLITLATVLLSTLMMVTWKQVGCWENSVTLFEHALKVTTNNYLVHNNLGLTLDKQGRTEEAIEHYLEALRIKPNYVYAHNNLGAALTKKGRIEEAMGHYLQALKIKPDHVAAHNNLGLALYGQGRIEEAIGHYLQALKIKPDFGKTHYNLGNVLIKKGRTEEAIEHYLEALRIKPDYGKAHYNLGLALYKQGRIEKAIEHYLIALKIESNNADLHINLGAALSRQGRTGEAIEHYLKALRIKPGHADAHYNLGAAFFRKGNIKTAIDHFREALKINPGDVNAKNNLKKLLMIQQQKQ